MQQLLLTLPEFAFIVATRGILGAGVGLLLAERFSETPRRAVGWALVGVGVATTVPAAMAAFGGRRRGRLEIARRVHSSAEL